MKKLVKLLFVFALAFGVIAQPAASLAAEKESVYYVSLGDSLAAGQTPNKTFGKGYTDFIADKFKEAGVLQTFVRDYPVSGYTTQNVLDDIKNNVTKGDNAGIQAVLKQATHVTIDAGANDLLTKVKLDTTNLKVAFDEAEVKKGFEQVQKNLVEIITTVKTLNPDVKIYLMGYYNAFPHIPADMQATFKPFLGNLNTVIEKVAASTGATYVSTDAKMAENPVLYLPNPLDIHLSEDGYKVVADLFWNVMKPAETQKPAPAPAPSEDKVTPVVYWDGAILKKGQIGRLSIQKSINLWKKADGKLEYVRTLKPGESYRVYGFDSQFGGQYSVGSGYYITKITGYVNYKTPSKAKLQLVNQ